MLVRDVLYQWCFLLPRFRYPFYFQVVNLGPFRLEQFGVDFIQNICLVLVRIELEEVIAVLV